MTFFLNKLLTNHYSVHHDGAEAIKKGYWILFYFCRKRGTRKAKLDRVQNQPQSQSDGQVKPFFSTFTHFIFTLPHVLLLTFDYFWCSTHHNFHFSCFFLFIVASFFLLLLTTRMWRCGFFSCIHSSKDNQVKMWTHGSHSFICQHQLSLSSFSWISQLFFISALQTVCLGCGAHLFVTSFLLLLSHGLFFVRQALTVMLFLLQVASTQLQDTADDQRPQNQRREYMERTNSVYGHL